MLRGDNEMISDDKRLVKRFNEHYIIIAERSSGLKPEKIVSQLVCHNEYFHKRVALHDIIKMYQNRSIMIKIKNNLSVKSHLSCKNTLPSSKQVTSNEVNLILTLSSTTKKDVWYV